MKKKHYGLAKNQYKNSSKLAAIISIPMTRNVATITPSVLSNLRAVGSSSLREMNTIMPAMIPKEMPYTRGPKTSFRTSHPRRAPGGEGRGGEGRGGEGRGGEGRGGEGRGGEGRGGEGRGGRGGEGRGGEGRGGEGREGH